MGVFHVFQIVQMVPNRATHHLYINPIRNKFGMLFSMIKDNNDIRMALQTKLDSSFTNAQYFIEEYAPPFRYDRNCHCGGILLFMREDIPVKKLSTTSTNDFERFFAELNFRTKTFLLCCSYNPHKSNIPSHLIPFEKTLNNQMTKYDNFFIIGYFKSELSESAMVTFLRCIICLIW